jgi:hypothetical protein
MAPLLGPYLPEEFRIKVATENYKIGAVFKCFHPIAGKDKRFILAGFKYDKIKIATVFINTEINPNFFPSEKLRKLHLLMAADIRPFLDYDSYIDCSGLKLLDSTNFLKNFILDPSIHIGNLSEADYKLIRDTIKGAHTITAAEKKEYGLFL